MAAAIGNVDDRDNWRVHFADTMRGGQYMNNWRMAELHAKEAPERVRELEAWGAVFDRTKDGRILQRNFGGHRYPRLAHVGDRTGLELIRTLQDHGVHRGLDVFMEHTVVTLLTDGGRVAGARGLRPRARPLQGLPREGRRHGHRRPRPRLPHHEQQLGVHRRRLRARLRCRRGAAGHGVHPVPSDRDGLAAERARDPRDRGRPRRGRHPAQQRGPPVHVRRHPGELPQPDGRQRGGGLALHPGRQERAAAARAAHTRSRRAVHRARGQARAAAARTAACSSTSRGSRSTCRTPPSTSSASCRACTTSSSSSPTSTSRATPMEVGPTTHYTMGGIRVDGDTQMSTLPGLFAAGEAAAGCTARTGSAATRCRT